MIFIHKSRPIILGFLSIFLLQQKVFCMEFPGNFSSPSVPTLSTIDYIKFFVPPAVLAIGVLVIGIQKSCDMCKKKETIKVSESILDQKQVSPDYRAIN